MHKSFLSYIFFYKHSYHSSNIVIYLIRLASLLLIYTLADKILSQSFDWRITETVVYKQDNLLYHDFYILSMTDLIKITRQISSFFISYLTTNQKLSTAYLLNECIQTVTSLFYKFFAYFC